jgi:hypothetical protein
MADDEIKSKTLPESTEEEKARTRRTIRRNYIIIGILAAFSAVLGVYLYFQDMPPPAHLYDDLAKCIAQSSTTFYGAWWCPDCAAQKTKFGTGAAFLPYAECSLPDKTENATCTSAGVTRYPTWVFADGTRLVGVQSPAKLAEETGCALPSST